MLILPGLAYLIAFIAYINPVEVWEPIKDYPFVHIGFLLAMFGMFLDIRWKFTKVELVPTFWLALPFVVWCVITDLANNPAALAGAGNMVIQSFLIFFLLAHGVQTFRGLRFVAGVILILDLSAGYVAVGQVFGPYTCTAGGKHINFQDDRECDPEDKVEGSYGVGQIPRACTLGDEALADVSYKCEQRGPFGFNTNQGRVTAFGWLADPNDIALMTGVGLPFAFAYRESKKKSLLRLILLIFTVVLFGMAAVFTKSRGGQLVYGTVLLVYFVRKYGLKGLFVAGLLAAPLMMLGGRSSLEASNSANHRIELWMDAVNMFVASPIFGVGCKEFMKHSTDAAHSAYANALAETGLAGYLLYCSIAFMSIKIPWEALKHCSTVPEARIGRVYALATLAALIGLHVDMLFLSHTYNYSVWMHYGLSGALYSCVKRHSPSFTVKYYWREFLVVVALAAAFVIAVVVVNTVSPPTVESKVLGA